MITLGPADVSGSCLRRLRSRDVADTSVEVETALLERLRQRRPGLTDHELLESVVLSTLGRATLQTMQERNALTEDEAISLGLRAVREARQADVSRLRAP
jgi:hypothetical protein